jgi:hypothetical protein
MAYAGNVCSLKYNFALTYPYSFYIDRGLSLVVLLT